MKEEGLELERVVLHSVLRSVVGGGGGFFVGS